jgi:hypothetical protein
MAAEQRVWRDVVAFPAQGDEAGGGGVVGELGGGHARAAGSWGGGDGGVSEFLGEVDDDLDAADRAVGAGGAREETPEPKARAHVADRDRYIEVALPIDGFDERKSEDFFDLPLTYTTS